MESDTKILAQIAAIKREIDVRGEVLPEDIIVLGDLSYALYYGCENPAAFTDEIVNNPRPELEVKR